MFHLPSCTFRPVRSQLLPPCPLNCSFGSIDTIFIFHNSSQSIHQSNPARLFSTSHSSFLVFHILQLSLQHVRLILNPIQPHHRTKYSAAFNPIISVPSISCVLSLDHRVSVTLHAVLRPQQTGDIMSPAPISSSVFSLIYLCFFSMPRRMPDYTHPLRFTYVITSGCLACFESWVVKPLYSHSTDMEILHARESRKESVGLRKWVVLRTSPSWRALAVPGVLVM